MGILDELAIDGIPLIFEDLAADGLVNQINITRYDWADEKGGRTKTAEVINATPINCLVEEKTKWRRDEGNNWLSYLEIQMMFPLFKDGTRLEVRTTDEALIFATERTDERKVLNLRLSSPAGAYYLLVGEIDNRDGQRVNGK